jgi:ubiquinone/menaquinone biosynthesis C-methylase UbiE
MRAEPLSERNVKVVADAGGDLEFTGERIVPGKTEEALFREHEERYVFAGQYVAGKDVLDVACGTGVGTSFLHRAGARTAWGLDIDQQAITFAEAMYPECGFARCEATDLCFADDSVDVVISFETLEHLRDEQKFLMECRRVLRPNGLMICSTPNREVFRWHRPNPYHVRELAPREFIGLFGKHFGKLSLFAQAERIYPLYVLRRLALYAVESLKLKSSIKAVLGQRAAPREMREQFFAGNLAPRIRPYRSTFSLEATYLIAVGRKTA